MALKLAISPGPPRLCDYMNATVLRLMSSDREMLGNCQEMHLGWFLMTITVCVQECMCVLTQSLKIEHCLQELKNDNAT